ncbi:MAG TPA: hypothetical protein VGH80_05705 [Xanthomonadaceae bacterium]|jgi:hypothetical protein
MRQMLFLLALLFLCACSQQDIIAKFTTKQEQATAQAYIERLRARDFDPIEKALDPSIRDPDSGATLARMAGMIPAGQPTSMELIGAHSSDTGSVHRINLTYEYDFGGSWQLAAGCWSMSRSSTTAGRRPSSASTSFRKTGRSIRATNSPWRARAWSSTWY